MKCLVAKLSVYDCVHLFFPLQYWLLRQWKQCVPLINASWLYWLTVHQLWSSFYFYPFSHKLFINFPVTCSSMGSERGTVNMPKILFIVIGMKTVPAPQFPWAVQCQKLKNYSPMQVFEGHIWLPTDSINRSGPFGARLLRTKEKCPFCCWYDVEKGARQLCSHLF